MEGGEGGEGRKEECMDEWLLQGLQIVAENSVTRPLSDHTPNALN